MLQRMIWAAFALGIFTNLWGASSYAQEKPAPNAIDSKQILLEEKNTQESSLENPASCNPFTILSKVSLNLSEAVNTNDMFNNAFLCLLT